MYMYVTWWIYIGIGTSTMILNEWSVTFETSSPQTLWTKFYCNVRTRTHWNVSTYMEYALICTVHIHTQEKAKKRWMGKERNERKKKQHVYNFRPFNTSVTLFFIFAVPSIDGLSLRTIHCNTYFQLCLCIVSFVSNKHHWIYLIGSPYRHLLSSYFALLFFFWRNKLCEFLSE